MQQIKCPNCGEVFTIDESNYDSIVRQVRDHQFNEELKKRDREYEQRLQTELSLVKTKTESANLQALNEKDQIIAKLKNDLSNKEKENELVTREAVDQIEARLQEKEKQISLLQSELKNKDTESELKVSRALEKKNEEISELKANTQAMQEGFRKQMADKDDLIAYYKDFKAKHSTKMIGEDLEQHCLYEFNRVRPLFQNAYFEKDNDASQGSKGDFIFRDYDEEGTEIVSIMFEMKNERDETQTKHKNEDFLNKLDKDRNEKKCEYAVLVSLLEMDNDLYNEGIVDMSYRYPKMYVVRPQNFIPIITILRNAAMNSLSYKKQLIVAQNQDLDYRQFEENMNKFKEGFSKNYELASRKFQDAIDDIDKTIKALEKTKADLLSSDRNLRLANDKAQDLSIRKLTKNAPGIAEKFKNTK